LKPLKIASLWAPVIGFMVLIYTLSSRQSLPLSEYFWDKALHCAAYGLFGTLCLRAFHGGVKPLRPLPTILALLTTLLYGFLDEVHQSNVPGRDPSALDWVADALGAALSVPLVAWLATRGSRGRQEEEPEEHGKAIRDTPR